MLENSLIELSRFTAAATGMEKKMEEPVLPLFSIQSDPSIIRISLRARAMLTAICMSLNFARDSDISLL